MRQIKKMMQRGLLDPEQEDPFSLFVASTNIRYCYYHDTHKVLGNTFGMCVLQVRRSDALIPGLLTDQCARLHRSTLAAVMQQQGQPFGRCILQVRVTQVMQDITKPKEV